jgi:hypothetical protein
MSHEMDNMKEARISIRSDGTIKFDRKAVFAFAGRGIEFVSFIDERTNRATGRWLTAQERRALQKRATRHHGTRRGNHVRLREVVLNSPFVRRFARRAGRAATLAELGNTHYRHFLSDIGINIRNERRYEARWHRRNSDHLIVRIK